jgi:Ubiquitin carboxyl-terminal hydrolase
MGKSSAKKRKRHEGNAYANAFDGNKRNGSGARWEGFPKQNPNVDVRSTHENPGGVECKKLSRRHVEFVYPKQNGNAKPFVFSKKHQSSRNDATSDPQSDSSPKENQEKVTDFDKAEITKESIDDILSSSKRKKMMNLADEVATNKLRNGEINATVSSVDSAMEGRLSGMSVEEAVRDKSGCRPRANSTDGELNLPRRGLCDEHMVLQSHKWNKVAPGLSPKGFLNLGNTCFLNSTLQCLVYLPPFCQSILAMQNGMPMENGRKASQGKKITLILRALFQRVHRGGSQHQGAIAPRSVVEALPTLGTCGSRGGGYKFRQGRQEDAHEFLIHLLDAMHDGELREAGKFRASAVR